MNMERDILKKNSLKRDSLKIVGAWLLAASLAAVMTGIAACSDESSASESESAGVTNDIEYEVVSENSLSAAELIKSITGQDMPLQAKVNYAVIKYASTYNGERVTLSGLVSYMDGLSALPCAVIGNHWTIASNAECPSNALSYDMALAITQQALVVNADYMGYGVTSERTHPYLCADVCAEHSVDCFRAAMRYVADKGIKMAEGYKTYNIGYSQGGAVALAVERYVESADSDTQEMVRLEKTLCGAGPYDPAACYSVYVGQDPLKFPVAIPMIIMGMKDGCPEEMEGVSVEDYFSEPFLKAGVLDSIKSKRYTNTQINDLIERAVGGATVGSMMSVAALDSTTALYSALHKALDKNDLTRGWTPKTRLQFFHSTQDDVVPYVNYENAAANLSNENVEEAIVGDMGSHQDAAIIFYTKIITGGINK